LYTIVCVEHDGTRIAGAKAYIAVLYFSYMQAW